MDLVVIRHGVAGDKEEWAKTGKTDDLRPLTAEGRQKMKGGAAGLRSVVPTIAYLATSPLVRARETADIVAAAYHMAVSSETDVLRPDSPLDVFIDWIASCSDQSPVAIVGHEPHLGSLVTWLMCGMEQSRIDLKKGSVCLLSFGAKPKRATATLCWSMTAKQLKQLRALG